MTSDVREDSEHLGFIKMNTEDHHAELVSGQKRQHLSRCVGGGDLMSIEYTLQPLPNRRRGSDDNLRAWRRLVAIHVPDLQRACLRAVHSAGEPRPLALD